MWARLGPTRASKSYFLSAIVLDWTSGMETTKGMNDMYLQRPHKVQTWDA